MLPKLFLVTCSLCATSMCLALPSDPSACLRGRIADTSGAPVANAFITIKPAQGDALRTVLSGPQGEFEVCSLAPGRYQVTTAHQGFAEDLRSATLSSLSEDALEIPLLPTSARPIADSGAVQTAAPSDVSPSSAAISSVNEFRYAPDSSLDPNIPNAPSTIRSHADAPHGQLYGLWGSGLVGQPNAALPDQLPLAQFGASIGGGLGNGRTTYFASFDAFGMDTQRMLAAVASAQLRVGKPVLPENSTILTTTAFDARIDHHFSQRESFYSRFRHDDVRTNSVLPAQNGKGPSLGNTRQITQETATAANTVDISPTTVNETRAQFVSNEVALPPGAQEVGIQSGLPTARRDRVFEAANNVYRQVGGQSLRFGGDFLFNQMNIAFLETAAGNPSFSQSSRSAGMYITSQRQVRPNLLLTTGVRYDLQPMRGFKTDTNNLSPQVGFAWSPSSRTVIRGGGSMYYDQVPLPAVAASSDPSVAANVQSSGTYINRSADASAQPVFFSVMSPLMQHSYIETANFGIEQQLSAHTTLSTEYQFARALQLAIPMLRPALLCTSPAACGAGDVRRAPEMGTGAESNYQGISVAFTQEPVRWGNYRVAYSYSSSEGSGAEGNDSYISDDLRRVSFTGVLHTSPEAASGWSQRLTRGFVLSNSANYSDRSEFIGINFINLDARLTKTLAWGQHYRLDALAETSNSFERTSAAFTKSVAGMGDRLVNVYSTYCSIASLQGPTGTQFGFRLGF